MIFHWRNVRRKSCLFDIVHAANVDVIRVVRLRGLSMSLLISGALLARAAASGCSANIDVSREICRSSPGIGRTSKYCEDECHYWRGHLFAASKSKNIIDAIGESSMWSVLSRTKSTSRSTELQTPAQIRLTCTCLGFGKMGRFRVSYARFTCYWWRVPDCFSRDSKASPFLRMCVCVYTYAHMCVSFSPPFLVLGLGVRIG